MSKQESQTPRIFFMRHGETEWTKSGRFTSFTDLELTPEGVTQVSSTAATLVGTGKLLDPNRLVRVFVSPRVRARETLNLLFSSGFPCELTITEDIAEWNYGKYEGLQKHEIINKRKEKGMDQDRGWNIWSDGCEDGESKQQITERLDKFISQIKEIQKPCMQGDKRANILIVAHGHILRCLVKRWIGHEIDSNILFDLDTGGIGSLTYKNSNIDEPALSLGVSLPHGEGYDN